MIEEIQTIKTTRIILSHKLFGVGLSQNQYNSILKEMDKRVKLFGDISERVKTDLNELKDKNPIDTSEMIVDTVCAVMRLQRSTVLTRGRKGKHVLARKFIAWYMRKYTGFNLSRVAEFIGILRKDGVTPDHSGIVYYERCINDRGFDKELAQWKETIDKELIKRLND